MIGAISILHDINNKKKKKKLHKFIINIAFIMHQLQQIELIILRKLWKILHIKLIEKIFLMTTTFMLQIFDMTYCEWLKRKRKRKLVFKMSFSLISIHS